MPTPPARQPLAGGFLIALGAIGGCAIGVACGQPSIGFLAGLAGGVVVAALLWLGSR